MKESVAIVEQALMGILTARRLVSAAPPPGLGKEAERALEQADFDRLEDAEGALDALSDGVPGATVSVEILSYIIDV